MNLILLGTQKARTSICLFAHREVRHYHYPPFASNNVCGYFQGIREEANVGFILGIGYRLLKPEIFRLCRFDCESPFGEGGLNGYAFVAADPINNLDPDGHKPMKLLAFLRQLFSSGKARSTTIPRSSSVQSLHHFRSGVGNQLMEHAVQLDRAEKSTHMLAQATVINSVSIQKLAQRFSIFEKQSALDRNLLHNVFSEQHLYLTKPVWV